MDTNTVKGTYVGVRFDDSTIDALQQYVKQSKLPNGLNRNGMHTTVLYSRKFCPNYEPMGEITPPFVGTPTELEVWPSQPDDDGNVTNCLVMKYDCPDLVDRHNHLMGVHGATYDFDEYKPHVTLSYDIGDIKVEELPNIKQVIKKVNIIKEYGEDLDLNWARNNTTKE